MNEQTVLLSPTNALRILRRRTGVNIGASTFYRWIKRGEVVVCKLGRKRMIPWPEVERLILKFWSAK